LRGYSFPMNVAGKVVIITGASEGIGAACARTFQARGARLALTARSEDKLRRQAGDPVVVAGDITDAQTRSRVVASTLERYGRVDILINNAGAALYGPSWSTADQETRALFELNLFAPLAMIRMVAPFMRKQHSGMIVNVGSIAGKITLPWMTLYSASKHALCALTDGLRAELKRDGIQAMAVCPGYVRTSFQDHAIAGQAPAPVRRARRFAISEAECAEAIARGVERNARIVVAPRSGRLMIALARLFPRLADAQLERLIAQRAEQEGSAAGRT
jgi:short-subunit dehydrogenase